METKGKHYIQDCINIIANKGFRFEADQAQRQLERLVLKSEDREETKIYTEEEIKELFRKYDRSLDGPKWFEENKK